MTERERVRKQIADFIKGIRLTTKADGAGDALYVRYPVSSEAMADQILAIDGLEIRADDQSYPHIPREDIVHIIMERDHQLKEDGFVKVAK